MEPNESRQVYEEYKYSLAEAQERVIDKIADGSPALAAQTIQEYNISPEFLASPDVQQAIMDQLVYLYSNGFGRIAPEFIEAHLATPEILHQAQLIGTIEAFTQGNFTNIQQMEANGLPIPEDILCEPTVQQALQTGLALLVGRYSTETLDQYRHPWQRS